MIFLHDKQKRKTSAFIISFEVKLNYFSIEIQGIDFSKGTSKTQNNVKLKNLFKNDTIFDSIRFGFDHNVLVIYRDVKKGETYIENLPFFLSIATFSHIQFEAIAFSEWLIAIPSPSLI